MTVSPVQWNVDYPPWDSPAVSSKGDLFSGGANDYLSYLVDTVKPRIDSLFPTLSSPKDTAMIGYSLGGLFSLYSLYCRQEFGKIGSLSGSLWFPNWMEFMEAHQPLHNGSKIYLSLGRAEEHIRNPIMASVGHCTRKAERLLLQSNVESVTLEWNNGGHFKDIPERFIKSILWLMH